MANTKKTQAEIAASAGRSKNGQSPKNQKNPVKKAGVAAAKAREQRDKPESMIPIRFFTSFAFIALFFIFLVLFFSPQGALLGLICSFICGIFGKFAFAVSIPALLYLFTIHAFSGDRPVKMRTICIGVFVILCGCISHLTISPLNLQGGFDAISQLYGGGIEGTTGGLVCGFLAMLVKWLCGPVISYVVLIIAAVFTLLAGMQITIPSLVRAVQERPKADWEEKPQERKEPASVVVDHIAKKRIEYIEQKRTKAEQKQIPYHEPTKEDQERAERIIREISVDVEAPVLGGAQPELENPAATPVNQITDEIPQTMPELKPAEIVPATLAAPAVPESVKTEPAKKQGKVSAKDAQQSALEIAKEIEMGEESDKVAYRYPPISLLKAPYGSAGDGTAEMRENSQRLNETLASFKIEAHIINVTRGPSVTRYEVELEKGVRLSKLTSAADDIALSLGATGVRIAAIPGKISVVGIEVPNRVVTTVSLSEVIGSGSFSKAKSVSTFAVGKDIGGNAIVGDISKLPHMLIAGTTGSGKSVCMNSIIISLLYKASPDEVKLIMVDPKMVELGVYSGIPHLLIPVVTDPKKAAGSLQWAVSEMMRRYKSMSDIGVKDLESFNAIMESQGESERKLPKVVVIIDELADLMLVAAKEVEESICRIAQMGRASGIHLIIATQRPSADVITGLMKANIPSRIAFAVASSLESRIILDNPGAEKLVGRGDMLYAPIGGGKPKRVQGCFVTDTEVEAVVGYVKSNSATEYDQQIMEEIEKKAAQTGTKAAAAAQEANPEELDGDEMLPAAVDVILETKQASVSMLQRRLKLGYARAARIVDEMEEKGIVGSFQGSKPREILITKDQWETMRHGGVSQQMAFEDLETPDVEEFEEE